MSKISFKLSQKGLDDLLSKINKLETELDKAVKESIKEVADEAQVKIIEKMQEPRLPDSVFRQPNNWSAIDTGELANSTKITTKGNVTLITQEGANAFNVEFGDGQYFYKSPYPDPDKIPAGVPEHQGAYFYYGAKPGSVRWDEKGWFNGWNFSRGQYGVAQMYHGGQYIRETLPKRVREKRRDVLSKI